MIRRPGTNAPLPPRLPPRRGLPLRRGVGLPRELPALMRLSALLRLPLVLAVVALPSAGCDERGGQPPDGGLDASADAGGEGDLDAGPDAGSDAEAPRCPRPDLRHAPGAVVLGNGRAVPVDFESVDASVILDAFARHATVEATVRFHVGEQGGWPVFDLRQEIISAELDGESLSPASLGYQDFGAEPGAELRLLAQYLPPCSAHTLRLGYTLERPDVYEAPSVGWDLAQARVRWDFAFTDLVPASYLEQWLPANLIYDRFALRLTLALHANAAHTLVTNADATELGPHRWQLEFPAHFTALSPMLVLWPSAELSSVSTPVSLSSGQVLQLALHLQQGVSETPAALIDRITAALEAFTASTGDYPHEDRLTVFVWDDARLGMEYDAATTTGVEALEHELFHLWYGRGVKPALGRDGWLDEAWDVFNTDEDAPFFVAERSAILPPVTLSVGSPFSRVTPGEAYDAGPRLFGHLAFLMGLPELRAAMAELFAAHRLEVVTTEQLEQHLYCRSEDPDIAQAFHRWVYGRWGTVPVEALPDCE